MAKLPKAPKRPKRSASLQTWERYDVRVNDWRKKVSDKQAAIRKKNTLIEKYSRSTAFQLKRVA